MKTGTPLNFVSSEFSLACAPVHNCCHNYGLCNIDKYPVHSLHHCLVIIYATLQNYLISLSCQRFQPCKTLNSSCTILSTPCLVSVNIFSKIFHAKLQCFYCINHKLGQALCLDRIFPNIVQSINVAAFVDWGAG